MRIARVLHDGLPRYGVVEASADGTHTVSLLDGEPYGDEPNRTGEVVDLDDVRLLSPVVPTKVIGIGANFLADDEDPQPFTEPLMFLKPSTAVCGPGDTILRPDGGGPLAFEGELVVVMGSGGKHLATDEVEDAIAGYTVGNDVCATAWQAGDAQWTRGKGSDTFCALGPWVETDLTVEQASNLPIVTDVGGERRQDGNTARLKRGIVDLVVHISKSMTLLPGDVILTGTPAGAGEMADGDVVDITIDGIGTLSNPTGPDA